VAAEVTPPTENPGALVPEASVIGRGNDVQVKIDQVRMIDLCPLGMTDPVRIMTGIAGSLQVTNVLVMVIERFIVQDAGPAVAMVTELISRR
jgi:hypothetical protein